MSNEPQATPDIDLFFKQVDAHRRKSAEELLKNISVTEAGAIFPSLNEHVSQLESDNSLLNKNCLEMAQKIQAIAADKAQLEVEKAELQRVVQEKDRILKEGYESIIWGWDGDCGIGNTIDNVLELTPKDLPKFIPEEEYLRLNDRQRKTEALYQEQFDKFWKLKSHAEAMAQLIKEHQYGTECLCIGCGKCEHNYETKHREDCVVCITIDNYRKDFPK